MDEMNLVNEQAFLDAAIDLARENVAGGGRPFGALIVKDGAVVASGVNGVVATNDPTAHAEMNALRTASQRLASSDLSGCRVYASGHPCPMCMAAMRMAGVEAVAYAYSNEDAAPFGLSTAAIHAELARPFAEQSMAIHHLPSAKATVPEIYVDWQRRRPPHA
jgi:tRNA(Arg) A34 adenosine deaminase TadA